MAEIPMNSSGKRPRFFPDSGADEMMSMMIELTSELSVMRERLYALEQVAADAGLPLREKIEAWRPNEEQSRELDAERQRLLKTVLRTLEANHVPGYHLRRSLDEAAEMGDDGDQLTDVVRAA